VELIRMIDGALPDGGAALSHLYWNAENSAVPAELRNFVRVSSEFYPQLETHYEHRIATWFAENYPTGDREDDSN
jgi:hypothetical protein